MARMRLPPAWESAPDILRTDMPQQDPQALPQSRDTPPPEPNEPRQSRRRISRRGIHPEQPERQWVRHEVGPSKHSLIRIGVPDPPYPVTPPSLERPQRVLPQLGYRAPTPLPPVPSSIEPAPAQRPDNKPPRLLQRQRQCARQLDASLPTLSLSALASGSILLVSAILFVRSMMVGTPHAVAGRSALIVFFALSVAAFIISFGLILGVLCRRARATKTAVARAQARREIELMEPRLHASEDRLPMYHMSRRNAICEVPSEPGVVVGAPNYLQVRERDRGRIRRFASPIRFPSRDLSEVPFSRPPTPHPRPPLSPLFPPAPSTPPPPIPERNPARLLVGVKKIGEKINGDASSTIAQPSPESGISPKTVPPKTVPQTDHDGTVSGHSTQMFNQHMLTAGTRELQAYLEAPSNSSLNTLAAYQHSESDSSSTQAIVNNDRSVYSDGNGHIEEEEDIHVGEASVLSMRKVGKARECYIPAPKSKASASKSPDTKKQQRSNLKVFTDTPRPDRSEVKPKAAGLGISIGKDQNKENVEPDQTEVETWSALGGV
ncbi:hypothetical protein E4T48_05103 [Aureobasidium sp. EXF-10727]|nr:hypothetical protein E4T48_05103 [Aureobasidium sp. EXF-10727]